jgi:hypothetical protein
MPVQDATISRNQNHRWLEALGVAYCAWGPDQLDLLLAYFCSQQMEVHVDLEHPLTG